MFTDVLPMAVYPRCPLVLPALVVFGASSSSGQYCKTVPRPTFFSVALKQLMCRVTQATCTWKAGMVLPAEALQSSQGL
jgi:hypothetical protein